MYELTALVEFPPKKPILAVSSTSAVSGWQGHAEEGLMYSIPNNATPGCLCKRIQHTLLVQDNDIAAVKVDGVRSTQAGHWWTD